MRELQLADIEPRLHKAILALNNAHLEELSALDSRGLEALLTRAFYGRGIGELEAVLIALDEAHTTYPSPNYRWFCERRSHFVYVDRIIVSVDARGKGHAWRLYQDLIARAVVAGHDRIVCEVNSDPPNLRSDAFHAKLGFQQVGAAAIYGGAKTVRYLELTL